MNSGSDGQPMWTTISLAKAAGCDPSLLRKLLIAGRLKGTKIGRDWFVGNDEAHRWLAERQARRLDEQ